MTQELTKNLMAVLIRGGLEIWIDEDKLEVIKQAMEKKSIIQIGSNIINAVDIMGVFEAEVMADKTHRKNGEWKDEDGEWRLQGDWQCSYGGYWHKKFEKCEHTNSLGYK